MCAHAHVGHSGHAVHDPQSGRLRTHFDDAARERDAEHRSTRTSQTQREPGGDAEAGGKPCAADPRVAAVDGCGSDLDDDVAAGGPWAGAAVDADDLRRPVGVDDSGVHVHDGSWVSKILDTESCPP